MKKYCLIFFIFISIILPAKSEFITGGVKYDAETTESTKQNKFDLIRNHLIDSNAEGNLLSLNAGITELKNRKIARFSDGSYGVIYANDPLYSWIYKNGRLISFIEKSSESYPAKTTRFKPDGSIINTGIKISDKESYIYSNNGILIAHWVGNICYDRNNNIIMTRKNED